MDGTEFGREVARQRAERKVESKLSVLRHGHPEAAPGATGADCAAAARKPWRRLDALRRQQAAVPMRLAPLPTGKGRFAVGR